MKKEVLISVLIGLSMGLIITYGIYRVQSAMNQPPTIAMQDELDSTDQQTTQEVPTIITLHSPEHNTVQTQRNTIITGTTLPNSLVVVFVGDSDTVLNSDASGNFTFETTLATGTNNIAAHVIDQNGSSAQTKRTVVVTSVFEDYAQNKDPEADQDDEAAEGDDQPDKTDEENASEPQSLSTARLLAQAANDDGDGTADTQATGEAAINIELVKERLQRREVMGTNTQLKRMAQIGEVQRVTADAVTIRTSEGASILPIAETLLLKDNKPTTIDEIIVGGWITALGYQNADKSFSAVFLLIETQDIQPKEQLVTIGAITTITTNRLTIEPRSNPGEERQVSLSASTEYQDAEAEEIARADLEEAMNVLIAATRKKDADSDDLFAAQTVRALIPLAQQ